jgi:hypothetical protein
MGAAAAMQANHFLDDDDSLQADMVLEEFEVDKNRS